MSSIDLSSRSSLLAFIFNIVLFRSFSQSFVHKSKKKTIIINHMHEKLGFYHNLILFFCG